MKKTTEELQTKGCELSIVCANFYSKKRLPAKDIINCLPDNIDYSIDYSIFFKPSLIIYTSDSSLVDRAIKEYYPNSYTSFF